jgi:hypothetical protein
MKEINSRFDKELSHKTKNSEIARQPVLHSLKQNQNCIKMLVDKC